MSAIKQLVLERDRAEAEVERLRDRIAAMEADSIQQDVRAEQAEARLREVERLRAERAEIMSENVALIQQRTDLQVEIERLRAELADATAAVVAEQDARERADGEIERLWAENEQLRRLYQPEQHIRAVQRAQQAEARLARVVKAGNALAVVAKCWSGITDPEIAAWHAALAATQPKEGK